MSIEDRISQRIRAFDVMALLRLLQHIGYQKTQIDFRSHRSIVSQPSFIEAITFSPTSRRVMVTLNYGLLSAQTGLPSYFFRQLDQARIETDLFEPFMHYFDHIMIQRYLSFLDPAYNPHLMTRFFRVQSSFLQLAGLRACDMLHWLFQTVFPELMVRVEKTQLIHHVRASNITVGRSQVGWEAVLGGAVKLPVSANQVTLTAEEETTFDNTPWIKEATRRLQQVIFPLLKPLGFDLQVWIEFLSVKSWAQLQQQRYLGYDQIRSTDNRHKTIRIFSGQLTPSTG